MKNMTHCKKVWNLLFINFKRFCHIIIVSVYPMSIPLNVLISHFSWASICVSVGPRKKAILLLDKHYYKTASGLSAHNRLTVDGGLVHPIMLNYYTMA